MNAVVFDLELVKRFKKGQLSEIVEIGACKVDLETKTITEQFQLYILPKSGYVSKSTRQFINMDRENLKSAVPFPEGIQLFANWLGEDYFLCSWGKDDRLHFISQCTRLGVSLSWFKNYNDIQQQIGKLLTDNARNQLGLKNALDIAGIEQIGRSHRGIDDAINTAQLLILHLDHVKLEQNTLEDHIAPKSSKSRGRTRQQGKKLNP